MIAIPAVRPPRLVPERVGVLLRAEALREHKRAQDQEEGLHRFDEEAQGLEQVPMLHAREPHSSVDEVKRVGAAGDQGAERPSPTESPPDTKGSRRRPDEVGEEQQAQVSRLPKVCGRQNEVDQTRDEDQARSC